MLGKNHRIKIPLRQKIILVTSALFLTIAILEVGLRVAGFIILSLQEHRNLLSIRQRGEYRIICFGESTTQGQYPPYLEAILNQRNIGIKFSVIDKGIGGISTGLIVSQLEANLDKYQPDLVVTMMGINDYRAHMPYEVGLTRQNMLFLNSFRTYKLARLLWLHIITRAKEIGFLKKIDRSIQKSERNLLPQSEQVYTGLGRFYMNQGNLAEAEKAFKKTLELNPQNDLVYEQLDLIYKNQGKIFRAEETSKKSLEFGYPGDQEYAGLGWFYIYQGRLAEAEVSFKKALKLNPKNDQVYTGLGRVYIEKGDITNAEISFKKSLEFNPQNDWAWGELGRFYIVQGKLFEAEVSFKKAIELNPLTYWGYIELSGLYIYQRRLDEAEKLFKKALKLNPKNDWAYGGLAVVYSEMGNYILHNKYEEEVKQIRERQHNFITINNYCRFKQILNKRKVGWICVQYPMRNIGSLKNIFEGESGIFFVDNEQVFKSAVAKEGYNAYFRDIFAGDFGHCTKKGNILLAENIAAVILKHVFGK